MHRPRQPKCIPPDRKIKNIKTIEYLFELLRERKNELNIHQHEIIDKCFFKENTDSWQTLFRAIRNRSFQLLKEEVANEVSDLNAIKILNEYRNKPLFNHHIRNPLFLHIDNTNTVNEIDKLIKHRSDNFDALIRRSEHGV